MAVKTLILGIDPGFTGALSVWDHQTNALTIIDTPLLTVATFNSRAHGSQDIDIVKVAAFIESHHQNIMAAVIERVSASPGAGVSSMFRFGEGYGILRGICAAYKIKTLLALPGVWKPSMGLSRDKDLSLAKARSLVNATDATKYFTRKKDNGRAEAFLLAVFGARSLNIPTPSDGGIKNVGQLF